MAGDGAIFIGKMGEALPMTLLGFAVVYLTVKRKWKLTISKLRVFSLFAYTFLLTGLVYGILYDSIEAGFGLTTDAGLKGTFSIPAQLVLSAAASFVIIVALCRPPQPVDKT